MIKKCKSVVLIVMILLFSSCVTSEINNDEVIISHAPIEFENEDIKAILTITNNKWVSLLIENKSNNVLQFITDLSTFNTSSGNSQKLVPEGTKFADVNNSIPSSAIPPKSKFQKSFFSSDSVYYSENLMTWKSNEWIPNTLEGVTFLFTYKNDAIDKYILFSGSESLPLSSFQPQTLGRITVKETFFNFLFLKSIEDRRDILYEKAMAESRKKYGNNIELVNLKYMGEWKNVSLLLLFSMLGFVEDATLTVDVISK